MVAEEAEAVEVAGEAQDPRDYYVGNMTAIVAHKLQELGEIASGLLTVDLRAQPRLVLSALLPNLYRLPSQQYLLQARRVIHRENQQVPVPAYPSLTLASVKALRMKPSSSA